MEKKEYREIDIPSLIRFVRKKEGMTQKEFAETFGFKESSPSMWELGKREAPHKILEFVFSRWLQQELDKAREEGRDEGINAVLYPKLKRDKNGTLKREGWVDTSKFKQ